VVVRSPEAEGLEGVHRHIADFAAQAEAARIPLALSERLFVESNLVFVSFAIRDAFDQTPGPNAEHQL